MAFDPWLAAEKFVSSDPQARREGLAILAGHLDLLFSPLVGFLLVCRIDEPDLTLRKQIACALARCFEKDDSLYLAPKETRDNLSVLLRRAGRMQVERFLEVLGDGAEPGVAEAVVRLLDRIPDASILLTKIAADRLAPFATRFAAIVAVGELGAVGALPALAGLKTRIEGQLAGQIAMTFAPPSSPEEEKLIEALKTTIARLREDG
ncbi:MAG: hypothetical protein HY260_16905 [Chloroflexi bacterium]|nr:hypothetical protein [Chloroflexota bacterium]